MIYTKSKDGIERANLNVPIRLTRDEVSRLTKIAKKEGQKLYPFLERCLDNGIARLTSCPMCEQSLGQNGECENDRCPDCSNYDEAAAVVGKKS